jgi:hypothetical protein
LKDGDSFNVKVTATPFLQDPELKSLRWKTMPPARATEPVFFTAEAIEEMATLVPEVDAALAAGPAGADWSQLSEEQKKIVRNSYYGYLLCQEHTRRYLLETNNLLLDLETGTVPALEDFKRLHRYLDFLRAFERREQARLENARRLALLDKKRYGQPRVAKLTVVAGGEALGEMAALDGLTSDDGTDETDA